MAPLPAGGGDCGVGPSFPTATLGPCRGLLARPLEVLGLKDRGHFPTGKASHSLIY